MNGDQIESDGSDPSPDANAPQQLIVRVGASSVKVAAHERTIGIGRTPENDIVVDEPSVSSRHATLRFVASAWELEDHSTYGTFLDGNSITRIEVTESMEFRLADPDNGPVLKVELQPVRRPRSVEQGMAPSGAAVAVAPESAGAAPTRDVRIPALVAVATLVVGLVVFAVVQNRGASTEGDNSSAETSVGTDSPTSSGDVPADSTVFSVVTAPPFDIQEIIDNVLSEREELSQREVTETRPAFFVSDVRPGQPEAAAVVVYLNETIAHLDTVWTNWFIDSGFDEPWVSYTVVMPDDPAQSACSQSAVASDYNNAFYCAADRYTRADGSTFAGGIFLPVDTMGRMWTGDMFGRQVADLSKTGDFAAAMLAAHEFGHHVQDELSEQTGFAPPDGVNAEQIADCFAGVWTYAVFLDGYLEDGDIDEAFLAVGVIGDADVSERSHGTGSERQNAYLIGYQGSQANPTAGVPANCIAAFWPEWGISG